METLRKLAILADAAKYDASCASSGTTKRDSIGGKGIGSTEGSGICHSYAPDGRCISLLKILLTNHCLYDCLYCINRVSSNVPRARFTVAEVVDLTLDFYRRNCIEGLFLSSGIIRSPDYTMEQVVEVARVLREEHDFRGYIHLKTIPEASEELLARAGRYADRLSINVELPTVQGLETLAPEKDGQAIRRSMARLRIRIEDAKEAGKVAPIASQARVAPRRARAPRFAPAGQSTQMIVGADRADDRSILTSSANLYGSYGLKRVYYSAFSPIPDASRSLPLAAPPLIREHRLYQADWLMRFYGFRHDEIVGGESGMLALDVDPKLAWALRHREQFPVDLNRAPKELLLRVPGLGVTSVKRLLAARRTRQLRIDDVSRLHVPLTTVLPFITVPGHGTRGGIDAADLVARMRPRASQGGLFEEDVLAADVSCEAGTLFDAVGEVGSTVGGSRESSMLGLASSSPLPAPLSSLPPWASGRSVSAGDRPGQLPGARPPSVPLSSPVPPAKRQASLFDDVPALDAA